MKNPSYDYFANLWKTQRDSFNGEQAIKNPAGDRDAKFYLPMTNGQAAMSDRNLAEAMYNSYLWSADFPEWLQENVSSLSGMIFQDKPKATLAKAIDYLEREATRTGESLDSVVRSINRKQLIEGRVLVLLDVNEDGDTVELWQYDALSILDWHCDEYGRLQSVLLDESGKVFNGNEWVMQNRFRIVGVDVNGNYYHWTTDDPEDIKGFDYYNPQDAVFPMLRGKLFAGLPAVIFNSVDLNADPSTPILMPVTEAALKAYGNSASLQRGLKNCSEPTLVTIGVTVPEGSEIVIGSTASLDISNPDSNADVKYLEVSGVGLDKQQESIEVYRRNATKHINLIESGTESGVALNTRLQVKTASLQNVALALQTGVELLLDYAATWHGAEPDSTYKVNTDFRKEKHTLQDLKTAVELYNAGSFTQEDVYQMIVTMKLTALSFEEWQEQVVDLGIAGTIADELIDDDSE